MFFYDKNLKIQDLAEGGRADLCIFKVDSTKSKVSPNNLSVNPSSENAETSETSKISISPAGDYFGSGEVCVVVVVLAGRCYIFLWHCSCCCWSRPQRLT